METDLGYDEGQFICLMLADSLRHQQASAQDIHRGACGRDAETISAVSVPLIPPAFPTP